VLVQERRDAWISPVVFLVQGQQRTLPESSRERLSREGMRQIQDGGVAAEIERASISPGLREAHCTKRGPRLHVLCRHHGGHGLLGEETDPAKPEQQREEGEPVCKPPPAARREGPRPGRRQDDEKGDGPLEVAKLLVVDGRKNEERQKHVRGHAQCPRDLAGAPEKR
jgi:hypothetical protein